MSEEAQDLVWPMPKFYFRVTFGSMANQIYFQEASGLDSETQSIEYRHGDNKVFSTIKMPGFAKVGNVTLKKGIFGTDHEFWEWFGNIKMNTIKRETVIVELLDEQNKPTMIWALANAWPMKITGSDLKADGNEVAVESIELVHEGLTIVPYL